MASWVGTKFMERLGSWDPLDFLCLGDLKMVKLHIFRTRKLGPL